MFALAACAAPAADPTPTEIPAPTKFAIAVASPTLVPTATATWTLTPSPLPTRTRTRTPAPTAKPTQTPLVALVPTATPTAPRLVVSIPEEKYVTLSVLPREKNTALPEVNLAARGFVSTTAKLALVDIDGPADEAAPPFSQLLADHHVPTFTSAYQVYQWDAACHCRGAVVSDPEVTLVGMAAYPDELIRVPDSGYNIGEGFEVLVLYADADRITLTFTREDNPVRGYCLYLEGVAVESSLVSLYQSANQSGRGELPTLRAGQAFARAKGNEIKLAIRDAGGFMDPRSRKDWWRR